MAQVNVAENLLFSQAAGNGFTARCLPSIDRERPRPPEDTWASYQDAMGTITRMRDLVIQRREVQDSNVELMNTAVSFGRPASLVAGPWPRPPGPTPQKRRFNAAISTIPDLPSGHPEAAG